MHGPYQVGNPALVSVVSQRDAIGARGGPVRAPVLRSARAASFPVPTLFNQVGTSTCTTVLFPCVVAGLPEGVSPLPSPIPITIGALNFDAFGNFTASIVYTVNPNATETLTLVGTVPEPSTMLLVAAGVVGLVLRRRAGY